MKKNQLLILATLLLFNSCGPRREEALDYYESILTTTKPLEAKSLDATAVIFSYADNFFSDTNDPDSLQIDIDTIKKYNQLFLLQINKSKVSLENIPANGFGFKLKNAAIEYVNDFENFQHLLDSTIISPLDKDKKNVLANKDNIQKNLDYVMSLHQRICLPLIEEELQFEQENQIFDFEKKDIIEKIEKQK